MIPLPQQLLRLIRHIQIETKKEVESLFAGAYRSAFKGQGIEFEEVREYIEGDDIRTIDWNVTARLQSPHVKTFREERELNVLIIADISHSMDFRSKWQSKREWMTRLGGVIALAATENGDRVGLLLAGNGVEKTLPPSRGFGHAFRLIRDLYVTHSETNHTDLQPAFDFIGHACHHPTICFILSDFLCPSFPKQVQHIGKKHDLFALRLFDPLETSLPSLGIIHMKDQETKKQQFLDWSDTEMQKKYEEMRKKNIEEHRNAFLRAGGTFLEIPQGTPLKQALRPFFIQRARRMR